MSKRGRPEKYRPEFCEKLIEFFDVEPYYDKELPHYKKGDISWIDYKRVANRLPTLRNFAKSINVDVVTVYDWINEKSPRYKEEFSNAFIYAKEIRKWFLVENGLNGCYNPTFSMFVATNITDMRNTSDKTVNVRGEIKLTRDEKKTEIERLRNYLFD